MAAESVRGEGLFQAHRALAALAEDPDQFDQDRERRFSEGPPSCRSRSGTTTRTASPAPANEELDDYNARVSKLYHDWHASSTIGQFEAQRREECQRIERAGEHVGVGNSPDGVAADRVRERWVEQGIWNPRWYEENVRRFGDKVQNVPLMDPRWLHEVPFDEEEDDDDDLCPPEEFRFGAKRKRQKTDEEARQSAERRAERLRKRELSRPVHQFNYQVSRERDRLLEEISREAGHEDPVKKYPADINTQAYTLVKDKWVSEGLWIDDWGILPGMSWLHERDINELIQELGPKPSSKPPSRPADPALPEALPEAPLSGDDSESGPTRVLDPQEASVED
ncbi:hypothetical protein KVR01_010600 [Diaporthe batatas]|uniref:uncharacterized protein n=1 Tax=Diaporthe batatas TaxID=748121 RepID=UPI001D04F29C|nr:uncharacterized protein KVR01_010600 [Diaporthe batatas]KAG8159963.1 hypothetical protein KVR01_010600 [Diaporthe batatas]